MYEKYFKRGFDIAICLPALIVLSPLMLFVSATVLIREGRPIYFKQQRIGLNGKPFYILKYRTMKSNNIASSGSFDAGNSVRVTATGNFLRAYKIDELPQLFNVLAGDMSIVGPRPEVAEWTKVYPEKWHEVLATRPGITDLASIEYRDEEEILAASPDPLDIYRYEILPRKLQYYLAYVADVSLKKDVIIIFDTVRLLMRKKK